VLRSRATSSDPSGAFLQVRGSPLVPFRHRSTGLTYFGTKRPPVHVPALRAAVGSLDPGCDDVRIAGRDDALGLQSVQADAYRPFRQPGVANQRGYRRECACAVRPGMVGQADQHELARAGRPGRGRPGRVPRLSAHEIASTLTGHPRLPPSPPGRPPGPGLSFGLIHPGPEPFTGERGVPVRPGQVCSRPVVDGAAQSSKACEGATPPWVQIPPPPPTTHRRGPRLGAPAAFPPWHRRPDSCRRAAHLEGTEC
jgi:hypothetical protein